MPNPFVSSAETEIRDAVVGRCRQLFSSARIIHELNVEHGATRADVAAVTANQLVLFEIKSERDKLHRLAGQLRVFSLVAHHVVVVAHERWCQGSKYPNCNIDPIMRHADVHELWRYPAPPNEGWSAPYRNQVRPWPHRMLRLLWTDELRTVAAENGVHRVNQLSGHYLANLLAASLPGAEIEAAVCGALRRREFAEADPPLVLAS